MKFVFLYFSISCFVLVSCSKSETTSPVRKNLSEAVFGNGYLEQEEEYILASTGNGVITELPISEGDSVETGSFIAAIRSDFQTAQLRDANSIYRDAKKNAEVNSPQLVQLRAQKMQTENQLKLDKTNYLRYQELRKKNVVSQLDFEKAELQYQNTLENLRILEKRCLQLEDELQLAATRSRIQVQTQEALLEDYRITAGNGGQVIRVFKKRGELVRPGDPIAKIGSGPYRIRLFVAEDDITKIRPGQKLQVHLNTYPETDFAATVIKILPGFDENEQSYVLFATFDKLPEYLFSGTQLQANIETGTRKRVLVIPSGYVSKGKYVTLENGSQKLIKTGSKNAEWTEIVSGISEKDVIMKQKNK